MKTINPNIQNLLKYGARKPNSTYWCQKCNVPLIQEKCENCRKQGIIVSKSFLRPVFKEELDFIKKQSRSRSKWLSLPDLSIWVAKRNYFYNGERIFTTEGLTDGEPLEVKFWGKSTHLPKNPLRSETIISRLKKANQTSLNRLEYHAIEFIESAVKTFHERLPIVSFSGGKDSCVVSHLVKLALGSKIIHIFSDTTMENPDTYKVIERFKEENPIIAFLTAKPPKGFFELAEAIGPPSRILRWCCTTHKTGPLGSLIGMVDGNGTVTFVGNRKTESLRRSKYNSIEFDHKVANEVLVNPILTWNDTEIWLYILTRHIQFSSGYRKGLLRAGCLYCPFNTGWSDYVNNTIYSENTDKWNDLLLRYATKINHKNPGDFVTIGWKVRAGGNGNKPIELAKSQCDTEENAYNYTLSKEWDESFWEYLKPLGQLVRLYDDGIIANYSISNIKTNEVMIMLRVSKPRKHIRAIILQQKEKKLLLQRLDNQISRFQVCALCGQCHSLCEYSAYSSLEIKKYEIDESKCTNCFKCIKKPCIAIKALKITKSK